MFAQAHVQEETYLPLVDAWLRDKWFDPAAVEIDRGEVRARLLSPSPYGRTNLSNRRFLARVRVPLLPVSLVIRNVRNATVETGGAPRRRVWRLDYADGVFELHCGSSQSRYTLSGNRLLVVEVDSIDVDVRLEGDEAGFVRQWDAVFGPPSLY